MKAFWVYLSSGSLIYLLLIAIYYVIKKIEPDGVSQYYYGTKNSKKVNIFLNSYNVFSNYMNSIIYVILFLCCGFLILSTIAKLSPSFCTYIISEHALRFQKHLLENLLMVLSMGLALITIFFTSNKTFSALVSTEDIKKYTRSKDKLKASLLWYGSLAICSIVNYSAYYISSDLEKAIYIKILSFFFSMLCALGCVFEIVQFIYCILQYSFSNHAEHLCLNNFYKEIQNNPKPIDNHLKSDGSIHYLLNRNKINSLDNYDVKFVNYDSIWKPLPFYEKAKSVLKSVFSVTFFHIIISATFIGCFHISCPISSLKEFSMLIAFSFFIHTMVILSIYHTPLKVIFLKLQMFVWGYELKDIENNKVYYLTVGNRIFTKKKYTLYFQNLYGILFIMQRALATNQECANFYFHQIIEEIDEQNGDSLLYGLVLLLYKQKFNILPYHFKKDFKNHLTKKKIDLDTLEQNMCAVMEEITRKDIKDDVKEFIREINSNNVVIIRKHKKKDYHI